jgi:hypothetical protein
MNFHEHIGLLDVQAAEKKFLLPAQSKLNRVTSSRLPSSTTSGLRSRMAGWTTFRRENSDSLSSQMGHISD